MSDNSDDKRQAELVEVFRKALLVEHVDDWTMETISEAAHVCAAAATDMRRDERHRLADLLEAHGETLASFTGETGNQATIDLIVFLLRLDRGRP